MFRHAYFIFEIPNSNILISQNTKNLQWLLYFPQLNLNNLVAPESRIMGLRTNADFSICRKVSTFYQWEINKYVCTDLMVFPVFENIVENGPTNPLQPQLRFVPN